MGNLKPGATYIYERVGTTVYSREAGSSTREVVGYYHDPYFQSISDNYELENVWKDIIKESRNNSALHEALERAKMLYYLSKQNGQE